MDPQELVPLEAGVRPLPLRQRHASCRSHRDGSRGCFKGPFRLCRLLALVIFLPSLFVLIPLYLRYKVFSAQMYPMSMTDMRLIDSKISPTWCQRQVVRSNATFNAFVVPGPPALSEDLISVSMTRELSLSDDMKEYWGFYLLKGSSVTVSACVSYPGASLIMLKGYKHLQECAYIGDDSSEELEELYEAKSKGLISEDLLNEKIRELQKIDGKANQPGTMKRHKAGVSFHDPSNTGNATSADSVPTVDITDHDNKELREILARLHSLRQAAKDEKAASYRRPDHLEAVPGLHRHRDTNVDRSERQWLSFKGIDANDSDSRPIEQIQRRIQKTTPKPVRIETTTKANKNEKNIPEVDSGVKEKKDAEVKLNLNVEERDKSTVVVTDHVYVTSTTDSSVNHEELEEATSKEVFEDVYKKLKALGGRGKKVLERLQEKMGVANTTEAAMLSAVRSEAELERLRGVLQEAIDEEKTRPQRAEKRREAMQAARSKREMMLGQIELVKELNEDDEARNTAMEEDMAPDSYAEHHEVLNETTKLDMSNSEFWSSFSSSEEALLQCEGLILNLPLTPSARCLKSAGVEEAAAAGRANALTYRVPANGYYFFVFNSENEVQTNYIRARFDLQKTRYDVARTTLRECTNSTERCDLPLDFFSSQKVVLEVPLRNNDSLWNEQFVIISECEPRTAIYLSCVIIVPILILLFGVGT